MSEKPHSNLEIIVFVLHALGGATQKVVTEHIAHEAFIQSPNRFSWVSSKYKGYPDKEVTRMALEDAAKSKNGALVKGKYARDISKDGWSLTPQGILWLEENVDRISKILSIPKNKLPTLSPTDVKRFTSRISRERAYQKYLDHGTIEVVSRYMFTDMLQVSPDASSEILSTKFDRMYSIARLIKDEKIIAFLSDCEYHFEDLLGS